MGVFLVLLGIAVLGVAISALVRGHLNWAHLRSRRSAGIAVAAAVVLVLAGGSLLPEPMRTPAGQTADSLGAKASTKLASTRGTSGTPATTFSMPTSSIITAEIIPTERPKASPSSAQRASEAQAVLQAKVLAKSNAQAAGSAAASRSSRAAASKAASVAHASAVSQANSSSSSSVAEASHAAASSSVAAASLASSSSSAAAAHRESASASAAAAAQASLSAAAEARGSASAARQASAASSAAAASREEAAQSTKAAATGLCGAPPNPYGYNYCGAGATETSPPADICQYFSCIPNFDNGTGYMEECRDGVVSMSGGLRGACSHHGGEQVSVEGP